MSNKTSIRQKQPASGPQKSGKTSIEEKHKSLGFRPAEEVYKGGIDDLEIDQELKKELEDYELDYRWINFKEFKRLGFHKRDWKPYKRESKPNNTVVFNIDADGLMTRDDLVLAVRPKSHTAAHREYLDSINKKKEGIIKQKTEQFRRDVKKSGIDDAYVVEDDD